MAGPYESGFAQQDTPWKLPSGCPANRSCCPALGVRSAVAVDRSRFRLRRRGCPVRRSAVLGVLRVAGRHGAQGVTASVGEPHPLRAGTNQAPAGEGQGDGSTDRPAGHDRGAGLGELLEGGPFSCGQLRRRGVGACIAVGLKRGGREAPGAQGAGLDLGPGPARCWDRPAWGRSQPQDSGLVIYAHETGPPSSWV